MSDGADPVESLARDLADGRPVDWEAALRNVADAHEERVVEQLRLIESVSRHQTSASATEEPGALRAPTPERWGDLEIRGAIGSGAFGELVRAWDPRLERSVALKLLGPQATSAGADSAIAEGRLLARVRHPNVVTVYGADRLDGRVGIWMELIEGRSLDALLREQGEFGPREAAAIGVDLCRALAAVHAAGIVHRDVKAQNVLRETGGRVVLTDFGAGVEVRPGVEPGVARLTGTPFYMAPELLADSTASRASDLYAVGVLLFHLVTRRFPVDGASWAELRARHESGERTLLRDLRPELPQPFVAAVERALDPDPTRRYATAGEMERALAVAAAGPGVVRRRAVWPRVVAGVLAFALASAALALVLRAALRRGPAPVPPPPPAGPYTVDASLLRSRAGSPRADRLEPGARLALGDRVTLAFTASAPLYVYVVDEDEAGHAYALFPLPGLDEQNPLAAGMTHVLPGRREGRALAWTVDSPGEREHVVVLASPRRLAEYEEAMRSLERPGETAVPLGDEARIRLRGLGRLSASPRTPPPAAGGSLFELAEELASHSERVSGVWLRRIDLENPRR